MLSCEAISPQPRFYRSVLFVVRLSCLLWHVGGSKTPLVGANSFCHQQIITLGRYLAMVTLPVFLAPLHTHVHGACGVVTERLPHKEIEAGMAGRGEGMLITERKER